MSDTPKNAPIASTHSPHDRGPDTVATPEGDNEYPPDVPVGPVPEGLHTPPGFGPKGNVYNNDEEQPEKSARGETKPSGIVKFIDEVARGEFM